jgi:hypothetical protein
MAREAARVVIRNLMEGLEIPGEMRVEWINSHRCLQGRWIDKEGQSLYGKTLEFRKYREAHEHLHSLIREALVARDTGATPTLDELKRSIRDVAEDLNRRLDQILSLDLD